MMTADDALEVMHAGRDVGIVAGDVYVWRRDILCRDGSVLPRHSKLAVLYPTLEVPYLEVGPCGYNWICAAANGVTVWATLEQCVSAGLARKLQIK